MSGEVAPDEDNLYRSVARALRSEIQSGSMPIGAALPSEAALRTRFGVSRNTVRDALRLLKEEQLVISRQGSATIVAPPSASEAFVLRAQSINDLVAYSADLRTEVRSTSVEVLDGRQAQRAGVPGGQEWLVVSGLVRRQRRRLPVCWSRYHIHRDYADVMRLLPDSSGPMFLLIEDMFGVTVAEMDQDITASTMPAAIAAELKVPAGASAVDVRRTFRLADGKIVQISIHSHPATRFKQSIKMQRMRA